MINNTVIGTLTVDGLAVTFGTAGRGLGGLPVFALVDEVDSVFITVINSSFYFAQTGQTKTDYI